jgi:hypothetical protein
MTREDLWAELFTDRSGLFVRQDGTCFIQPMSAFPPDHTEHDHRFHRLGYPWRGAQIAVYEESDEAPCNLPG